MRFMNDFQCTSERFKHFFATNETFVNKVKIETKIQIKKNFRVLYFIS